MMQLIKILKKNYFLNEIFIFKYFYKYNMQFLYSNLNSKDNIRNFCKNSYQTSI